MTEAELNKKIDDLTKELNDFKELFKKHTHNGFDSRREFHAAKTLFYGDIEFPYKLSEKGYADFSMKTPLGFGISVLESVGAAQYGDVTITSQPSNIVVGGTSTNGGITLTDGSGSSTKYFKLFHESNGDPYVKTDVVLVEFAGTGATGGVLKNLKNAAASALSGTQKDIEINIGGTAYYFTVYPTKA